LLQTKGIKSREAGQPILGQALRAAWELRFSKFFEVFLKAILYFPV
jgi:hypothetical protein